MKRYHAFPTREMLHEMLTYDENFKGLYWREWKNGRKKTLDAGCVCQGHRMVKIGGVLFKETDLIRIYLEVPANESSPCSVCF